jgi:hypothetical protein
LEVHGFEVGILTEEFNMMNFSLAQATPFDHSSIKTLAKSNVYVFHEFNFHKPFRCVPLPVQHPKVSGPVSCEKRTPRGQAKQAVLLRFWFPGVPRRPKAVSRCACHRI